MRLPCPNCGKSVDSFIVDGIAIYYEITPGHPAHECGSTKTLMVSNDRCPYCGEKGDMSKHICKR